MLYKTPPPEPTALRAAVRAAYRADETACVLERIGQAALPAETVARIEQRAAGLVEAVRRERVGFGGIDAFLHEYALTSREGVTLMCLAEALLRIPDDETADRLIRDKIGGADWERHLGHSDSWFVNASTWGLMLTGRVLELDRPERAWRGLLGKLVSRSGEPVIRQAVAQAMRILGRQFVMGRTIQEALQRAQDNEARGYRHSYDMLGEAARTAADAERYFKAYAGAIEAMGKAAGSGEPIAGPGISVKLSALHPRFEFAQRGRAVREIAPRLIELCRMAKARGLGLTVDAEEADRLEPTLDILEAAALDLSLKDWNGLGIAVQAYQKRAVPTIDWLVDLARRGRRRLVVRLVKGAYWDTEIKLAQVDGLSGYPVFTRKPSTDVSYLACASRLLRAQSVIYPAFASHNAHTIASVEAMAGSGAEFEFQRLHGMGEALYDAVFATAPVSHACRIYAPVGSHEDLLAYLVRRLLENGANSSFVNRIVDEDTPVRELVAHPVAELAALSSKPHPRIALPRRLYGTARLNAQGVDLSDSTVLAGLEPALRQAAAEAPQAGPLVSGQAVDGEARAVTDPADRRRQVGSVVDCPPEAARQALAAARAAQPDWNAEGGEGRAACLRRAADLYEAEMPALMALAIREAGKTLRDAVAEVREAVDFLRYYALRAEAEFRRPRRLPGPTGERNTIGLHGRGVFLCISPWNFPLAIFTGQVAAALAAGNSVLAKPAEQTPLIAHKAVTLLHQAGVPAEVLHLLPGEGPAVAGPLLAQPGLGGVAFTGSTATARAIQTQLAAQDGPILPLIAETGGLNAMVVDSSALPEQVTRDVVASAFQSAGQRCSALRVLFLQDDVAEPVTRMIAGAMAELVVGDPGLLATDVGPVIDREALAMLTAHAARMEREARRVGETPMGRDCEYGSFFAPRAYAVDDIAAVGGEKFGPILHIVRFDGSRLDAVVDAINATGYGLTLGVHSRIDTTVEAVVARARVGNIYVNRNQIGAVVGVQPFGGEGLSGTGPKAGGPHYLHRFAVERVVSTDITAVGGNAALMAQAGEGAEAGD